MASLFHSEIPQLLHQYGYWAVGGIVGAESIGLPLPGETTLIAAAIYAGTSHDLNIGIVIAAAFVGAVIGDSIGFWIGRSIGFRALVRYGHHLWLTERRIKVGQYLFSRHGGKVVFFGRFVAVLRAIAALLAGMNRMEWRRFLLFNAAGGAVWAGLYGLAAYGLGNAITRFSGPVGIGALVLAAIVVGCGFIVLRRHEQELSAEAERKFPGPLRPPKRRRSNT